MSLADLSIFTWIVILTTVLFDFCNGWNDCANAIATTVATRVLTPFKAILYSSSLNFIGALAGTKVAKMVGGGIVKPDVVAGPDGQVIIMMAMVAGSIWIAFCTFRGLPISGSHSLMGALVGAAVAGHGVGVLKMGGVIKILVAMLVSPVVGLLFAWVVIKGCYYIAAGLRPRAVTRRFSAMQIITTGLLSFTHGQNDAQKVMGVITLLLFTQGYFGEVAFKSVSIPIWVIIVCGLAMGLGTAAGGWRVMKTLGMKLSHMKPIDASSAELAGAAVLMGVAQLGIPVSTTHTITGTIVGAGLGKRGKNVKWSIGAKIIFAWVITLPAVIVLSYLLTYVAVKVV